MAEDSVTIPEAIKIQIQSMQREGDSFTAVASVCMGLGIMRALNEHDSIWPHVTGRQPKVAQSCGARSPRTTVKLTHEAYRWWAGLHNANPMYNAGKLLGVGAQTLHHYRQQGQVDSVLYQHCQGLNQTLAQWMPAE